MKFSYTLAAVFATAAVAAPVAQAPATVPVDAGLLAKLSPDVAALVTGLGLTTLAPGLAATLITLSEGLKVRTTGTDVPVDAGLLAKLSPDVAALVTGLGLTSLAPGLAATLITLSEGLKTRQLEGVVNTVETVTAPVTEALSDVVKPLGGVAARQELAVPDDAVAGLTSFLTGFTSGVATRDVAAVPVDAGLLAKLSPDIAALVTGLGLTSLAPGLAATLITLSEGLKTRQTGDIAAELKPAVEAILAEVTGAVEGKVVPTVQSTVEGVVSTVGATVEDVTGAVAGVGARTVANVPVDAGLLAKLSPDVAALVTGLGLTSLAPGLASTLITLSEGLKTRTDSVVPDIPVDAGLLAKLSPDVAALVSGLGLTSISPGLAATLVTLSEGLKTRQLEGVVNTVETVTAPVTEALSDVVKPLGGVAARQVPAVPAVDEIVEKVTGLASGAVIARQSSDPLAKLTQAVYAILGEVTDIVSGVVGPVEATVGQVAAPVGAVVGAVGARETPSTDDVVAKAKQIVTVITTNAGSIETVSKAAGAVPVDAGLLAQLSAPIAALVSGLGLVSIAPALAATLITLSQGL
ncbi:hypothetical protein VE03_06144 [Pseudogymnoascus sp. 23342-1-I1]|nr:hypothetical protein VE03_06144 [Pseudogymnoascus sp. 23342-1-I1]